MANMSLPSLQLTKTAPSKGVYTASQSCISEGTGTVTQPQSHRCDKSTGFTLK